MKVNNLSFVIGGEAGAGINLAGFLLGKSCVRGGLNVFGTIDYQSLIRGGHNAYYATVSEEEVFSQSGYIDLLLALNEETIYIHKHEFVEGAGIVYDGESIDISSEKLGVKSVRFYSVPLGRIVKELKGAPVMRNTVAIGAAISLINYDLELVNELIRETSGKEEKRLELNLAAAKEGYEYAEQNYKNDFDRKLEVVSRTRNRMFLTGSEAVGLGAIKAGCKFYAAYPN
ncbi:MAG: 2-oxoacid:acceptor oxidoreductase family protein [Candidatus Jordarchaeum sp.]|uniref:2-oxoacid:acceptor oxidoreductase family protein n=1 Tax=Candidatus Jordarchaeum sp. TaxID=2823881 RepID=UPI00404B7F95